MRPSLYPRLRDDVEKLEEGLRVLGIIDDPRSCGYSSPGMPTPEDGRRMIREAAQSLRERADKETR